MGHREAKKNHVTLTKSAPDGNYLYYTYTESANLNNTDIYSVPALGGSPRHGAD
jgi:hypothetical protein